MPDPRPHHRRKDDLLSKFFADQFRSSPEAYSLDRLAEFLCTSFQAMSCIIWELDEDLIASDLPKNNYLYALARYDEHPEFSELKEVAFDSETEKAIRLGTPIENFLLSVDELPFVVNDSATSICFSSWPLEINREAHTCVNLYRDASRPFSEGEVEDLEKIVSVLPILHKGIRHNQEVAFVQQAANILTGISTETLRDSDGIKRLFQAFVQSVATVFRCREVSLFLRESDNDTFALSATTWQPPPKPATYNRQGRGLTSYVLAHGRPVRVVDLRLFERNISQIQIRYPKIDWADSLQLRQNQAVFAEPLSFIAVPIEMSGRTIGVIRCCSIIHRPHYFTRDDIDLLQMFASLIAQVCLCAELVARTHSLIKSNDRIQLQVREDISHQLRGPIEAAHGHMRNMLSSDGNLETKAWQLRAIQGLLSKARRVNRGTILYLSLARGEELPIRPDRLMPGPLAKVLIEAAADTEVALDPSRGISIQVDRNRIQELLSGQSVLADMDLIEQAIGAVLDNAGKYSFPRSEIWVGVVSNLTHFSIVVQNRGIAIRGDDISKAIARGWRSAAAQRHTGEGSGIGLWLVDQIMKAHNGHLNLTATDDKNITTVRLLFPLQRKP